MRSRALEKRYGVPKEVVVAILGVETSYGGNKGSYPVIDALYTLAFAYPRSGDPAKAARGTSARRSSATNWRSCSRWARKRASTSRP